MLGIFIHIIHFKRGKKEAEGKRGAKINGRERGSAKESGREKDITRSRR